MSDPAGASQSDLLLADGWRRRAVPAGQRLWQEGEEAGWLALVERGALRVEVDDRPLHVVGPGEVLGELAVLGDERHRSATVVAEEACTLWELDHATVQALKAARAPAWQRVLDLCLPQLARRVDVTRSALLPGSTLPIPDPVDLPVPARYATAEQALAAVPGLARLSAATAAAVTARARLERVEVGAVLVQAGAPADRMVVLASGKADLWSGEAHVGEFEPGTLLGADTLVRARAWHSTVIAATPAQVVVLTQDDWWELPAEARLELSEALFEVLRQELLAANAVG